MQDHSKYGVFTRMRLYDRLLDCYSKIKDVQPDENLTAEDVETIIKSAIKLSKDNHGSHVTDPKRIFRFKKEKDSHSIIYKLWDNDIFIHYYLNGELKIRLYKNYYRYDLYKISADDLINIAEMSYEYRCKSNLYGQYKKLNAAKNKKKKAMIKSVNEGLYDSFVKKLDDALQKENLRLNTDIHVQILRGNINISIYVSQYSCDAMIILPLDTKKARDFMNNETVINALVTAVKEKKKEKEHKRLFDQNIRIVRKYA